MNAPKVWDRHAINAEIRRRGMTLTGIARDAGLYSSCCRQGLLGQSITGAKAIAVALDVPFRELFPDSYSRGRHDEAKSKHNDRCDTSPKRAPVLDTPAPVP